MILRLRVLVLCVLVCAIATLTITVVPAFRFAYADDALHVAIETCAALVASIATFLLLGRVSRTRLLNELTLASGLGVLALSNLAFATIPAIVAVGSNRHAVWGTLVSGVAAALLIASSSVLPRRSLPLSFRAPAVAVGVSAGVVAATALFVAGPGRHLPQGVVASTPVGSSRPSLDAAPAVLALLLLTGAIYLAAASGFFRRSRWTGDELDGWLAVGCVLAGASRVNYFLYPTLHSRWVYSGDVFRLGFYLVLLVGAAREVASYWASAVRAAHLEARRQLARDLHDGFAQELAFIARNARLLEETGDPELVVRILRASERARSESRHVIAALSAALDQPLDGALLEAARETAARYDISLDLRVAAGVVVPPEYREALARIASEAIANAARHSGASDVLVELKRLPKGARLRVVDRGRGFDTEHRRPDGFGLISMRERAEALGARFRVQSALGRGTEVEVLLP